MTSALCLAASTVSYDIFLLSIPVSGSIFPLNSGILNTKCCDISRIIRARDVYKRQTLYGVDGDLLERQYRNHLSNYLHWGSGGGPAGHPDARAFGACDEGF